MIGRVLSQSRTPIGVWVFLGVSTGALAVGSILDEKFRELTLQGVATGSRLALVALGFVVIYRATGVINFAQGGLVLLGAYFAYNIHVTWGIPFYLAMVLAMLAGGAIGSGIEVAVLARLIGRPPVTLIMVTIGLLLVIQQLVTTIWGADPLNLDTPWGIDSVAVFGVTLQVVDVWTIALSALALVAFFVVFRYTRVGLAMRATAIDQEAALAQGISAKRVFALSWAISGVVAVLAGIMIAAGPEGVSPGIDLIALAAFPAIILGGLDSPGGAVVGGLVIGVAQVLTSGYQPEYAEWLGTGFNLVMPYLVMIVILMVRPYGLFGTRDVERV